MPRRWYAAGGMLMVVWWCIIWWGLAPVMPGSPKAIEFVGTLLTLLPVVLDLMRKLYIGRHTPRTKTRFTKWAVEEVQAALLEYDWLYGLVVFVGVSLIAIGFAMELRQP